MDPSTQRIDRSRQVSWLPDHHLLLRLPSPSNGASGIVGQELPGHSCGHSPGLNVAANNGVRQCPGFPFKPLAEHQLQVRDELGARLLQAGNMEMTVVLVLGGARSGKSRIAQELAEAEAGPLIFAATAETFDAEMADRIARHKADRGGRWTLMEAPSDLPQVLASEQAMMGTTFVDCLTVWLGNLMHYDRDIDAAIHNLTAVLQQPRPRPLYLVSNEVGRGIVPDNAMERAFRDHSGRLHQRVANVAQRAIFVTAGLLKSLK